MVRLGNEYADSLRLLVQTLENEQRISYFIYVAVFNRNYKKSRNNTMSQKKNKPNFLFYLLENSYYSDKI